MRLTKKFVGAENSCGSKRNASMPPAATVEPHVVFVSSDEGSTGILFMSIEMRFIAFSPSALLTIQKLLTTRAFAPSAEIFGSFFARQITRPIDPPGSDRARFGRPDSMVR